MATFRFAVEKRPTRSKQYNIYLFVTIAGKTNRKKTGVVVDHVDDFNYKAKQNNWIRSRVLNAKSLNEQLRLIIEEARETFNKLEREGEVTAVGLIKNITKETVSPSFIQFAEERAKAVEEEGGWRNAKKYNGLINKLKEFQKKQKMSDIRMEDLTVELLEKFKNFLHKWKNNKEKGKLLHPNSIEVQFTVFKALVNKAVKLDLIPADKSPFLKFTYKGIPTYKDKLDIDEVKKIIALELPENSRIWHVKNCFLFSFYCAGIRAGDLLQLRWQNITKDLRLIYTMNKNDKPRDLVLVRAAVEILNKYYSHDTTKPTDYIFPFLNNEAEYAKYISYSDHKKMTPEVRAELYNTISAKNALLNNYLKKIADRAEISKKLSTHIARHSFAKIAKENELDSSVVKELLAHSNLATTERYMGNFDTKKTDNALINLFGSLGASMEAEKDKKKEILEMMKNLSQEDLDAILKEVKK